MSKVPSDGLVRRDEIIEDCKESLLTDNPSSDHQMTRSSMKYQQTGDEFLDSLGILHPYPIFITVTMAFLWMLSVMSTMSPSYMAPMNPCVDKNCTFITVQNEFNIRKSFIDPGEMTASVYFLGNMVLGQIFATFADRIGRRPVLIMCLFIAGTSGTLAAFAPTFETMLIGRFFQGSCFTALTMVNWVMCCESITFSAHGYAAVLFGLCWVLGYCIITPIAIYFSNWRYVQLATSVPCLFFGVFLLFTLPESFSFLIAKQKRKDISEWIRVAQKYGKIENQEFDANQICDSYKGEPEKSLWETLKIVCSSSTLMTYTTVETLLWIVDLMIYSALSLASTGINSSQHISYLFSGLVEIPSYFLIPAAIDWLGRKPSVMISHLISAFALLSMYLFDQTNDAQIFLIIWLTAKFAMSCSFMLCFVYGAELFPTNCRTICLGTCATISNIGAMIGPHVPAMDVFFPGLHYLFYAFASFICTVLTTILPETKDTHGTIRSQQQSIA